MGKKRADRSRLALYDRLVNKLAANCPLGDNPSPKKAALWRRAYNALFSVEAAAAEETFEETRDVLDGILKETNEQVECICTAGWVRTCPVHPMFEESTYLQ